MKTLSKIWMAFSLMILCGGMAYADVYSCPPGPKSCTPTEWSANVDYFFATKDASITFDLTDYNFLYNPTPYQPGVDTITSALLTFNVNGTSFHTDTFNLLLGSSPTTTVSYSFQAWDYTNTYNLTGSLLYDLQQDGKIKVVFDGTGNYPGELDWIRLTADGYSNCPVPEPGTILLLGIGVLGIAFYGKRRMKVS